jgi:hypothetical protein
LSSGLAWSLSKKPTSYSPERPSEPCLEQPYASPSGVTALAQR